MKSLALLSALSLSTVVFAGEFWRPLDNPDSKDEFTGAVMATVAADGSTTFECVGYASSTRSGVSAENRRSSFEGSRRPSALAADPAVASRMTPDTVFWMASNTKGIAAATALAVITEGKLQLDDPVEKYFPSWKNLAAKNRPTLRMLLSHTAGLPFFTDRPLPDASMSALAERGAEQPLAYEPGTKYAYSNWGIDVAMAMVEKATGRPFDVEMRERIFKPLGMDSTSFVLTDEMKSRQVELKNVKRGLAEPFLTFGSLPEAGGGLLSTPRDMAKFFKMIADGGRAPDGRVIVSAALMKAWRTRQTAVDCDTSYSFGMHVSKDGTLGHGGQAGTWGEASGRNRRARIFMVNVNKESKVLQSFRANWKKLTQLDSPHFGYSSEYLAIDRTADQRKKLIDALWRHDTNAETRLWPDGKVPLRRDDKPLRFVENELWQRNVVVSDINDPFFVFYSAPGVTNAPVTVVLPGGGYAVLGWNKEGTEIARWLNGEGVSAAVLLYRAPLQRQAALCDVQRTIGILRRDAVKYNVDPHRVGVIGFSAGANLAVAASTNWRKRAYERVDDADDQPCRPDYQLPIYLWDVLERDPDNNDIVPLLVNGREPKLRAEYPVDAETPPAFLAQAKDDFCQIETTLYYYRALEAAGVRGCQLLTMASGGHGYGLRQLGKPSDEWKFRAAEWLKSTLGKPK